MLPNTVVIRCKICDEHVNSEVVGSYIEYDRDLQMQCLNSLLRCPKCDSPTLICQYEDMIEEGWEKPSYLYPRSEKSISWMAPPYIRDSYNEALLCFDAKAYTACAVMCRRTLEAVCSASGEKSGGLIKKLVNLKEKGIVDQHLYDWATMLRMEGNKAAHNVEEKVNKRDAQDYIEFSHALVEYIFTYQNKYKEFIKRKENPDTKTFGGLSVGSLEGYGE